MGRAGTFKRAATARAEAARPYSTPDSPTPIGHSLSFPNSHSHSPPSFTTHRSVNPTSGLTDNGDGTFSLEPDEFGSYQGFPSIAEYTDIEDTYLKNLSSRKREKALISQEMYDSIHTVLMDPSNTTFGNPQFRFWVRKMFVLASFQGEYTVTHDDKPVAAKEQIYQILVHCHGECYHGGRDKSCAQIKQYYSWIPKELVAQFVKACPTCVLKRSNNPKKFVSMLKDIGGATGADDQYIDYFTSPLRHPANAQILQQQARKTSGTRRAPPPPLVFVDQYNQSPSKSSTDRFAYSASLDSEFLPMQPHLQRRTSSDVGSYNGSNSGTSSYAATPLSAIFPLASSSENCSRVTTPLSAVFNFGPDLGSQTAWNLGDNEVPDLGSSISDIGGSRHYELTRSHSSYTSSRDQEFLSAHAQYLSAPLMGHSLSEGHARAETPYSAPARWHPSQGLSLEFPRGNSTSFEEQHLGPHSQPILASPLEINFKTENENDGIWEILRETVQ